MSIGEQLLNLRKSKSLSQEEVAEKLNVSRQTVSKWETDQSTPDLDKIIPICELYGITANELLTGEKQLTEQEIEDQKEILNKSKKKAKGIAISILVYFLAIVWIMVTIPVLDMNPIIASAIFLIICGIATSIIVYTCIVYKKEKKKEEDEEAKFIRQIDSIVSITILIIYLAVSFATGAWHITWLLWIVDGLIMEIVKLIVMLRRNENEK